MIVGLRFGVAAALLQLCSCQEFATWLRTLPHRHKIVIAGNHDKVVEEMDPEDVQRVLGRDVVYLHPKRCTHTIEMGFVTSLGTPATLRICGLPYSVPNSLWSRNKAFQVCNDAMHCAPFCLSLSVSPSYLSLSLSVCVCVCVCVGFSPSLPPPPSLSLSVDLSVSCLVLSSVSSHLCRPPRVPQEVIEPRSHPGQKDPGCPRVSRKKKPPLAFRTLVQKTTPAPTLSH